ncbi:MAG: DHH family phosphoesterase [Bacilli bacterium]
MKKVNFGLKLTVLIITGVQVLGIGVFSILYVLNSFNLQETFLPEYVMYLALGLVVLNCVFALSVIYFVNKKREQSDVKMGDIIGSDVKEAYIFGKIGLAVVNEEGTVLWVNDLLEQRQINIINRNIYEWCPKLKDLQNDDVGDTISISQNNLDYQVKFLKSASLFIFKDVSDYEFLFRYTKEQATCLGIIMIDNYADIVGNSDLSNDLIQTVRNDITDYCKKYNCLLRLYRNDAYFVVCNFESLREMEADGFSLIDTVRQVATRETIHPTLSIGFAHDFPDVNKLNEMASNAIDIAMSRGGDQVVVSKYGSELQFFGGRTEAVEIGNKVKIRVFSDSLMGLISRASNVVIMGHVDMDMDALGSCLGIKAICDFLKKPARIVFDSKLTERKTRSALTSLFSRDQLQKMVCTLKEAQEDVKIQSLVVVCDVSRPSLTMCPKILEQTDKVVVVDHHRRATEFIENPVLCLVEPSASSASELVAEIIKYNSSAEKVALDKISATIMLAGIFLDTAFYKSKTVGLRTFDASMILKEYGADNAIADDILKDEFEEYALVNKIISTIKTPYYGVCYCVSDEIIERSTLAKVGNQCIQLKGINAAFVIGKTAENEVRVSARSDGTINVQVLCEKFGGGGHFSMAAAAFKDTTIKKVEETLLDVLDNYLSEARVKNSDTEE